MRIHLPGHNAIAPHLRTAPNAGTDTTGDAGADPASGPITHAGASEGLKIAGIDPNHITSGSRAAKEPQLRLQICEDGPASRRVERPGATILAAA